jgi:hypothetical protein
LADITDLSIISGGQTGVDRAALDAALRYGVQCGGYCPKEFWAEDGKISNHYPLTALDDNDPAASPRANVEIADGLCVLCPAEPTGGTEQAISFAKAMGKAVLILADEEAACSRETRRLDAWFRGLPGGVINVAGPRLSEWPEAYIITRRIFDGWLRSKTDGNT